MSYPFAHILPIGPYPFVYFSTTPLNRVGQITRYLVDFNRLPFYALSINTKREGEIMMNTKFCISTGHWITYECLLDTGTVVGLRKPTNQVWMLNHDKQWVNCNGESITIEDMLRLLVQPEQVVEVLYCPNV